MIIKKVEKLKDKNGLNWIQRYLEAIKLARADERAKIKRLVSETIKENEKEEDDYSPYFINGNLLLKALDGDKP